MDTRTWLGLQPTHNPTRWYLPVEPSVCTGHHFLFGGCGLGAAMSALEGTTGREVVWATAQYLSYAKTGTVMDIDVVVAVEGRSMTQARATGHVGGTEILTVNAALGGRDFDGSGDWVTMPDVPGPMESPPRIRADIVPGSLNDRMTQRIAAGPQNADIGFEPPANLGPGRIALWLQLKDLDQAGGPLLAVLGDYVPMGISWSLDVPVMSNSLDNTIRVIRREAHEWYLLDIRVDAVRTGIGHGSVHIWSPEGALLATASQTAMVRPRPANEWPEPGNLKNAPS